MKTGMKLRICILNLTAVALLFPSSCQKDTETESIIQDVEGIGYGITTIGDQVWMTENLRVSHFRDGDHMLGRLYDALEWISAGAACAVYPHSNIDGLDNESEVAKAYGFLYNWNAVKNSKGLCPTGYHVPTMEEWDELVTYLGGEDVAGSWLKSKRTEPDDHPRWDSPNEVVNNPYHFKALPGGFRDPYGQFEGAGTDALFWSSNEYDNNRIHCYWIGQGTVLEHGYLHKRGGASVRCIQD